VLAHVLFMDIVGCSKLPSNEQKRIVGRLQELVRGSAEFQRSRDSDQLISLPTGDGMALAFFNKLDAAVLCAIETTKAIQAESLCKIRMGVHTGPVFVMDDINHKRNISGAGINRAERVMSCGEDGHILLSDNVAESLRHLSGWPDKIREVGDCQVKDGWIRVWNLVDGPVGNPALPRKSKRYVRRRQRMLAAGAAALVLLVVASMFGPYRLGRIGKGSKAGQDEASIAVLPFSDISPERNQEYFSDGLAEELVNGLAKIPGLRVAGRTSSFQFKGKNEDCRVIGEKLNVANLLEGSVRKHDNDARITVQLIKAEDGFDLWSEEFDRKLDDIFAVQEEISRKVTAKLQVKLLADKAAVASARSTNAQAYNAYLQGRYFYGRHNQETLEKAAGYFEQAIRLDRTFAPAWVGLGESRSDQAGAAYIPVEDGYRKAREAVERALALDANLGEAYAAMGWIKMLHDWDWAGADKSYQRALSLEPGNASVISRAGTLARFLGRLDEAIERYSRAVQIDALNSNAYGSYGIALHYAGQQEKAKEAFQKALELAPEMAVAHSYLGRVHLAESHPQEALAEMEQEKDPALRLCGLALAYHALGRKNESDANLADLIAKFQTDSPYQIAEVHAFRGGPDRAFEWLERAYAARDPGLSEVKVDPLLKSLGRDPRYVALVKKMRL